MQASLSFAPCARPLTCSKASTQAARPQRLAAPVRSSKRSEIDLSDEYAAVESLASQDDVLLYWNHQHEAKNTRLHDVMSTNLVLITPEASLAEAEKLLAGPPAIEGLPVVDANKKLVGVISKKDLAKGGATVKDLMTSPAISLKASGQVADAAVCMTEHKFHRVPVVDEEGKCVGIVTRTNIFWALTEADQEADPESESPLAQHGLSL